MSHTQEGTLQAYLDDQLRPEEQRAVAGHVDTCARCATELELLRRASERFSAFMALLDAPAPRLEPARLVERGQWRRRTLVARRTLARAAAVLVFLTAGALAAMPGSPIRRWAEDAWQTLFGEAAAPAAPATVEQPDLRPASGVAVRAADGAVRVVIEGAPPETRVRVRFVAGDVASVGAAGGAVTSRFTTGPGTIRVQGGDPGDLVVELPETVQRASVELNGRLLVIKEEGRLRYGAEPSERDGRGAVFRAPR
ncbi:MAG: anti-sigma factor family protein [Longimicrobiales bacterium]